MRRATAYKRKATPFELTPQEERALALFRGGKTRIEIAAEFGVSSRRGQTLIRIALEKDELRAVAPGETASPGAAMTPRRARGDARTIVDVRRGIWKSGGTFGS